MPPMTTGQDIPKSIEKRAEWLFHEHQLAIYKRTDALFGLLLFVEWVAGILIALVISPRVWAGQYSDIHIHVWMALILGGLIAAYPIFLAFRHPGETPTRYAIAIAQMLYSTLLIHLTGGRIETHFHVFGSLAFLSFYRDWRVLIPASLVVVIDHLFRGLYFPQSVYGINTVEPWRFVEHGWWVLFEDIILVKACLDNVKEMRVLAYRQAEVEQINANIEATVQLRTEELNAANTKVVSQLIAYKKAESERQRLADVVMYANDAIFTISVDNVITSWNKGAERIFGYTATQARGQHLSLLTPPGKEELPILHATINNGAEVETYETQFIVKNGRSIDASVSLVPICDESSNEAGWSLTVHDITEKKAADKRIKEFYSMVSHELRTPLASIRGTLGLIEGGLVEPGSIEAKELVETARGSSDRLIRLINDMLDLKKIESGKMELKRSNIVVNELILQCLYSLTGIAEEAAIKLVYDMQVNGSIYADWDKSMQILTNLVSNAIKFSLPESQVLVRTQLEAPEYIRFSVIDTGPGISAQDVIKLFGKFQQLDSSDTRQKGGTGLGLAISKALVEEHGGSIGVESTPGEGSTFWFMLPTNAESQTISDEHLETAAIGQRIDRPAT